MNLKQLLLLTLCASLNMCAMETKLTIENEKEKARLVRLAAEVEELYSIEPIAPYETKPKTESKREHEIEMVRHAEPKLIDLFSTIHTLFGPIRKPTCVQNYSDELSLGGRQIFNADDTTRGRLNHLIASYLPTYSALPHISKYKYIQFKLTTSKPFTIVHYSPDKKLIFTINSDNKMQIWNAHNGNLLATHTLVHKKNSISHMRISCTGDVLLITSKGTLYFCRRKSGESFKYTVSVINGLNIQDARFSQDGTFYIAHKKDPIELFIWNNTMDLNHLETFIHENPLIYSHIHPSGDSVILIDTNNIIYYQNLAKKRMNSFTLGDKILNNISCTKDSKFLVTVSDNIARVWQTKLSDENDISVDLLNTLREEVHRALFSRTGKYVVTFNVDNSCSIWNIHGELIHTFNPDYCPQDFNFSEDDRYFAALFHDKVDIFDIDNLIYLHSINNAQSIAFNADDNHILAHYRDGQVKLLFSPFHLELAPQQFNLLGLFDKYLKEHNTDHIDAKKIEKFIQHLHKLDIYDTLESFPSILQKLIFFAYKMKPEEFEPMSCKCSVM